MVAGSLHFPARLREWLRTERGVRGCADLLRSRPRGATDTSPGAGVSEDGRFISIHCARNRVFGRCPLCRNSNVLPDRPELADSTPPGRGPPDRLESTLQRRGDHAIAATQRQRSEQCSRAPIRSRRAPVTAFRHIAGNGPLQAREPAEAGRGRAGSVFLIRRSAIAFDASCLLVKAIRHGTHEESSHEAL